jgi:hypothetical protein
VCSITTPLKNGSMQPTRIFQRDGSDVCKEINVTFFHAVLPTFVLNNRWKVRATSVRMAGVEAGNRVQQLPHTGLQAVLTGNTWKTQRALFVWISSKYTAARLVQLCSLMFTVHPRCSLFWKTSCTDKYNQQLRRQGKEENGHRKAKVRLLSTVAVLSITTDSTLLLCADRELARSRHDCCGVARHEVIWGSWGSLLD